MKLGDKEFMVNNHTGEVFEMTATRLLSADEVKQKQREHEAKVKSHRAEHLGSLGEMIAALFSEMAASVDGSNGEPECAFCGHHHEDAFTSITAVIEQRIPTAETVTFDYTNETALEEDVLPKLRDLEKQLGYQLHESEPKVEGNEDNSGPIVTRTWVGGSTRNPTVALVVKATYNKTPPTVN